MKVIIDIDERAYKGCLKLKSNDDMGVLGLHLINATANGTLLSDNATNGDMIKALFSISKETFTYYRTVKVYGIDCEELPTEFLTDWWNAPYKENKNETDN